MKILLVTSVDPWARSVATVHKWVAAGRALGHDVAVYGAPNPELPGCPFTTDLEGVDLALFVIQVPSDFPDMPHLARVLDGIPRERRVVVDLWGRFNDTIRLEHDFNHLEKLDGHLGWEWEEAIAGRLRHHPAADADAAAAGRAARSCSMATTRARSPSPTTTAREAAAAWRDTRSPTASCTWATTGSAGSRFAGSSRSTRRREARSAGLSRRLGLGRAPRMGRAEGHRGHRYRSRPCSPSWAWRCVDGVRFDEVKALLGEARFAPVFHRPLFRHLGFVTNRTFETF